MVGNAHDIFVYNMVKWLKKSMDVDVDVFEFYPNNKQGFGNEYYNTVGSAKSVGIPYIHRFINPFIGSSCFKNFLKGRHYDIIHCHWIVPPIVLTNNLKNYCKKLVITFWGGEFDRQKLLESKKIYLRCLYKFVRNVDCVVNDREYFEILLKELPSYLGCFRPGTLGSGPLEILYELMEKESKQESKKALGIPLDKITVQIGYSGKVIHQHLKIIDELKTHPWYREKIHLMAPMTRGAGNAYMNKVEEKLKSSGFSYSLIKGRFLSDIEIARLRNATDITLQLSTSDGFSRSIVESFCGKTVVIYGSWLDYSYYMKSKGFKGVSVDSIKDGVDKIDSIISDFSLYKNMTSTNCENGKHQAIWSECIKDWVDAYNELLR